MPAAAPPPAATATTPGAAYRRHQPETTALYEVVRDNLETLYGAIDEGALAVRIPKHARKELEAYLGVVASYAVVSRACGASAAGRARHRSRGSRP